MDVLNSGRVFPQNAEETELRFEEREYNKRVAGSKKDLVYRNRTCNVAWVVVNFLKNVNIDELEVIMLFQCDKELLPYVRMFEKQLLLAKMNPDKFRKNLHDFFSTTARKIKEENAIHLISEFHNAVTQSGLLKGVDDDATVNSVFSSYLSMTEQLFCYLIDDMHEEIVGLRQDGTFILTEDIYPLIDYFQYEADEHMMKEQIALSKGNKYSWDVKAVWKRLTDNFKSIGYEVKDMKDLSNVIQSSNNFTNNNMSMFYYIDERTSDMIPNGFMAGYCGFEHPRKWLETDFYKNALKKRNFTLPSCGVVSSYYYAGGVREIVFKETFRDDAVILLWKMRFDFGGITTGYYDTSTQIFYSNYRMCSDKTGSASAIENFVLENYYMLTIKDTESEKKKRLKMWVRSDDTPIDKIPRWGNQPIVDYNLCPSEDDKQSKKGKGTRKYVQGEYDKSKISISANVRRLPVGHKASYEALQNAEKYGYEIEDGYTFVLPFERNQRHIKVNI